MTLPFASSGSFSRYSEPGRRPALCSPGVTRHQSELRRMKTWNMALEIYIEIFGFIIPCIICDTFRHTARNFHAYRTLKTEAENISTPFVTSHDTTWCHNINSHDKIGPTTLQKHINLKETTT